MPVTDFLNRPVLEAWAYKKCFADHGEDMLHDARNKGVGTVYISTGYLDILHTQGKGYFLTSNTEVLMGSPSWVLEEDHSLAVFTKYLAIAKSGLRCKVHLDIEPWAEPAWKTMTEQDKASCVLRYGKIIDTVHDAGVKCSIDVVNQLLKVTMPDGTSAGEYLARKADKVCLMDYRQQGALAINSAYDWSRFNENLIVGVNIPQGKTKEDAQKHAQLLCRQPFIKGVALHPLGDFV